MNVHSHSKPSLKIFTLKIDPKLKKTTMKYWPKDSKQWKQDYKLTYFVNYSYLSIIKRYKYLF
jgi:hypothetical protein